MTHEERSTVIDRFDKHIVECRFCGIHSDICLQFRQHPDGEFASVFCRKCGTSGPSCEPGRAMKAWGEMMHNDAAKSKYQIKTL